MKPAGEGLVRSIRFAFIILTLLGIALIYIGTFAYSVPSGDAASVRIVDAMIFEIEDGRTGTMKLPGSLEDLSPRTKVTLLTNVRVQPGERLLVKTVYAPLTLYADGQIVYQSGQVGSYPGFMHDPPTMLSFVELPDTGAGHDLRFEFLSPTQRSALALSSVYIGTEGDLLALLAGKNSLLFVVSAFLVLAGMSSLFAALTLLRPSTSARLFIWLGLTALSTGTWGLGECNLTVLLIPYPSLLYVMAFLGLFTMTLPILCFGILAIKPNNRNPLSMMIALNAICLLAAVLLQLGGWVSFSRSMYAFHILEPLLLSLFVAHIAWEYFYNGNQAAKQFFWPMLTLAVAAVLEVVNYRLRFTDILSLFFLSGMLVFIFFLAAIGVKYLRSALRDAEEKKRLEMEMSMINRLLSAQREQYHKIAENSESVKAQRHDLRHQYTVLKQYSSTGDAQGLNNYLDELTNRVSQTQEHTVCENFSVNAIALHYLALAQDAGITTTLRLHMPPNLAGVLDSDLCVIIGNLLENAVEACSRQEAGKRYIKMDTRLQNGVLTIVMDNSFDGLAKEADGVFPSIKRDGGEGIGLASVRALALKYGGNARFEVRKSAFLSSVYIVTAPNSRRAGDILSIS